MDQTKAELKDLAYWALKVAVRGLVGEILIRRALSPVDALQAVVDGVDEARDLVWQAKAQADAGH